MATLPVDVAGVKARPKFRAAPLGVWRGLARREGLDSRFRALVIDTLQRAEVLHGK